MKNKPQTTRLRPALSSAPDSVFLQLHLKPAVHIFVFASIFSDVPWSRFYIVSLLSCTVSELLLVEFSLATRGLLLILAIWGRFTLMPSLVVTPANIWKNFTSRETGMVVLLDTEDHTIISSFVWTKH